MAVVESLNIVEIEKGTPQSVDQPSDLDNFNVIGFLNISREVCEKMLSRYNWTSLLLIALLLPCGASMMAQVSMANVAGIVEDSTGARIPGSNVKLINELTGTENTSTSNDYGAFMLAGVLPGSYLLQVERDGFATVQFSGITLNIGDSKNFLIRMRVGSIDQVVVVDAARSPVDTADASVSTVVDRRFVANIPLNGRSFQDLISMTPGATTQSPQGLGPGDFSINGQNADTNLFIVDGISGNFGSGSLYGSLKLPSAGRFSGLTAIGSTQSLVSVDALQEFRVLSSTYSAEYGHLPGGQFSLLSRSGTNDFHGSAYDYYRSSAFDARDWFTRFNASTVGVSFHQQNFGGTVGGPVMLPPLYNGNKRTFFFVSYEGLNVVQPSAPLVRYAPDRTLRSLVPDALKPILRAFPTSSNTVPNTDPVLGPFVGGAFSLPSHINAASIRLDHTFSSRVSSFIRYSYTPSDTQSRLLSALSNSRIAAQTATLGATAQLSPRWSNDFRAGYASSSADLRTSVTDYYDANATDLSQAVGMPLSSAGNRAEIYLRIPGTGESTINQDFAANSLHQWNFRDTLTLQAAQHLVRFGVDERRLDSAIHPPAVSVQADYFDRASLLSNQASNLFITRSEPASPTFNEFAAFVQDDWKLLPSLTLSLGLRWEVDPPPGESHGRYPYTLKGDIASPQTLVLAPRGTSLWRTNWFNVAPRVGAAWLMRDTPGGETVLRAGVGIYFDSANRAAAGAFNALGFSSTIHPANLLLPIASADFDFASSYRNSTIFLFPERLQLPYSLQWDIALERALGAKQKATFSYIANSGERLLQPQLENVASTNPNFSEVYFFPHGITSSYQSMQMRFQRSIATGLQALASYTWAHTLDYGSTYASYAPTHGNSDLDVRHNLQIALSWDSPKLDGDWKRKKLLSGWGIDGRLSARTAFPITMLGNLICDPVTGERYYSGVDMLPDRPRYLYGPQYPGGKAINGGPNAANAAFVLPALSGSGNAPRNTLRGFDATQINLSLRKQIPLYDRVNLQLRADTFNLFNHPDLGYVETRLTDALSGRATLMLNQSFGPSSSLYQQGGPRSVQLMLKIEF